MRAVGLVMACWACTCGGRRSQRPSQEKSQVSNEHQYTLKDRDVANALHSLAELRQFQSDVELGQFFPAQSVPATAARIPRLPLRARFAPHRSPLAHITAQVAATTGGDVPKLKSTIYSAIGGDDLSVKPSSDRQMELNELILELSSNNPTAEPARSPLLNGKWDVVYAGAPGSGLADTPTRLLALALYATPFSPSVLAQGLASLPFDAAKLGSLTITINSPEAGQHRVSAETSVSVFGGAPEPVTIRSTLQPRSAVALREDFVEVEAFGWRNLPPGPLAFSRSLYVAYLDEEMLVLRDDTNLPMVLRRADAVFSGAAPMYAPPVDDDDSAPGAS